MCLTRSQDLSRLAAARKPSIYPAWQPPTNPAFIPPGSRPQTQRLSRLAAAQKPSVYPAWQPPKNPAFIPLGGCSQPQCLSRLAAAHKPSVCPAWRAPNPEPCTERIPSPACGGRGSHEKNARIFFMGTREGGRRPEGGIQNQDLSRLAAARKPRVYPAWWLPMNPAFIPLGGCPRTQRLSRLADAREPSIYPAWWPPINPVFIPLGSRPQTQCLSRLAAAHESSVYPAWWHSAC